MLRELMLSGMNAARLRKALNVPLRSPQPPKKQYPRASVCCRQHPKTCGENPDMKQAVASEWARVAAKKSFAEARRRTQENLLSRQRSRPCSRFPSRRAKPRSALLRA